MYTLLLNEGIPRAYRGKKLCLKNILKFPSKSEGITCLQVIPLDSDEKYLQKVMPSFSDFKYLQKVSAKCPYISDEKYKFFRFDK